MQKDKRRERERERERHVSCKHDCLISVVFNTQVLTFNSGGTSSAGSMAGSTVVPGGIGGTHALHTSTSASTAN